METRTQKQRSKNRHDAAIELGAAEQGSVELQSSAQTLHALHVALYAHYGPQHWWPAETRFEMIVGAYLTQATAWRSVEHSIKNLRDTGLLNIAGIRKTPEEELRVLIRPSGFVQRKAASLRAFVNFLDQHYAGSLDRLCQQRPEVARQQLLALPGVGPETADAILLYALDHPVIVVDEYLRRVGLRHGLGHGLVADKSTDARLRHLATEMLQQRVLDTALEDAREFHALIVEVGKQHCRATAQCAGCPLERFLPGKIAHKG